MPSLSAVVCAHNEEARLAACLESLSFADEIVVVLDRCTDRSLEIASRYTQKILVGAFPVEGDRRQAAMRMATGDWIFELDADERPSLELCREIRVVIEANEGPSWYRVPIDNYVGDRLLRYGWGAAFGTSSAVRLYRTGSKSWGPQLVHPKVRMTGTQGIPLQHPIAHRVDADIGDMLGRLDRYTSLRARELAANGEVGTVSRNVLRGLARFYKCYVLRHGYREGQWGFLLALMAALYPLLSTLRARLEMTATTAVQDVPAKANVSLEKVSF
jgi:glycosyltransferase involved in cell wall biosynthesis